MDSSTFKTIHLCDGLEPTAPSATGNQEEIRDVITNAAKIN